MTKQFTRWLLTILIVPLILAVGTPFAQAESHEQDNDSVQSFEDCVADAADHCRDQCDDEYGLRALDCARDCLEKREGECEEYDYESDDSEGSEDECQECENLCEDACDRFQQKWRRDNCLSDCKSRCDYLCG